MNLLHNFFPLFVALDFRLDTFIIYLFRPFEFGLNHGVTNAKITTGINYVQFF